LHVTGARDNGTETTQGRRDDRRPCPFTLFCGDHAVAYLRGDYYVWADGDDRVHIWACDGADGWEDSGWASDAEGKPLPRREAAAGVSVPKRVLDEYVMMRLAELIESGDADGTIDRALRQRNFGGAALTRRAEAIKETLRRLGES
jgi:hypothetical protein